MTKTTSSGKGFKFELGQQVGFLSHPFIRSYTDTKITAYNHFTPPVMVVVEKHQKSTYDPETGKRTITYKCIYYSTKAGKFEEDWFKEEQLKEIENEESEDDLYRAYENKDLRTLQRELVGKQVILKSVDAELGKKNIYQEDTLQVNYTKEKTLLDFLPPLGTIIKVVAVSDAEQYDKNNGKRIHQKSKLKVKVRWFNNKTSKYSEEELPMVALKRVDLSTPLKFEEDYLYMLDEELKLENNKSVKLKKQPYHFKEILFKHYYYEYHFKNLLTGEVTTKCCGKNEPQKTEGSDSISKLFKNWLTNAVFGFDEEVKKYGSGTIATWYKIIYADQKGNYTVRLIYARRLVEGASESEYSFLEANCLLRKGAIRHFRVDRVIAYEKLPEESSKLFVVEGV